MAPSRIVPICLALATLATAGCGVVADPVTVTLQLPPAPPAPALAAATVATVTTPPTAVDPVTVTVEAPTTGGTATAPAPALVQTFSGRGTGVVVVRLRKAGTLRWRSAEGAFTVVDSDFSFVVQSDGRQGSAPLAAGLHRFTIAADGDWTLAVR